jgi:phage tail sheath protein FI
MGALVLLDPPTAIVDGAVADGNLGPLMALADQVRAVSLHPERVVLYTSGLIDTVSGQAVPAAAAMAGLMASVDGAVGFWAAPAGVSHPLVGLRPSLHLTTAEASTANDNHLVPFLTIPGYGTVAWGDLTIGTPDGHTYVSVQRAMVAIESSISTGMTPFVFDTNDAPTWAAVNRTITQFLTVLWKEGALVGESPSQAFSVEVGLGTTMTGEDVLQGIMNVEVQVALIRPAEFIVLTFQQEMQTS